MSGTGAKRNNEGVVWALLKFTKNWKRSKKGHLRLQPCTVFWPQGSCFGASDVNVRDV